MLIFLILVRKLFLNIKSCYFYKYYSSRSQVFAVSTVCGFVTQTRINISHSHCVFSTRLWPSGEINVVCCIGKCFEHRPFVREMLHFSLYYPYRQYTNLFMFWFVSGLLGLSGTTLINLAVYTVVGRDVLLISCNWSLFLDSLVSFCFA